jgi:5'-methylthioinosine phosphorylase
MGCFAIVGGSGLSNFEGLHKVQRHHVDTSYGDALVIEGELQGGRVLFMPRHGEGHSIPPHKINYRANMAALKQLGTEHILACNAVGGIHADMGPGKLIVPDQIIDYTYGREHTYSDGQGSNTVEGDRQDGLGSVDHVDFTHPYESSLRRLLIDAIDQHGLKSCAFGVYGCTQGPRLESAAEVKRLKRDGCDLVGMTGMPEAVLARELGLPYASVCLVVNWAAGLTDDIITMAEITRVLATGIEDIKAILGQIVTDQG